MLFHSFWCLFVFVMYRRFCLILLYWIISINGLAQLRYPVSGTFQAKSAQGMVICGDYAFLMSDGGGCRQLDLKSGNVVSFFMMACTPYDPHLNNACLGVENYGKDSCPVVYLSECREGGFHCFVESLDSTRVLLQTIIAQENGKTVRAINWVVDRQEKLLYAITRVEKHLDSKGSVRNTITKFRLPHLAEGADVVLTENDMIDRFDVVFPNILQGCKIRGPYLYLVTGLQQSQCHRKDSQRAIQVIDLNKKKLVETIDLTFLTTNEPEDIDFYKGKCLVYCGQEGGIYEIKLK